MKLKIITPEKVVFDNEVEEISTHTVDGSVGILKGHVPFMSALDIGLTKIRIGSECKIFTTMGGILQFGNDECLILTDAAEAGDEIDELRAKESLDRATKRLREANARIDSKRAEASIARAKARLKAKLAES